MTAVLFSSVCEETVYSTGQVLQWQHKNYNGYKKTITSHKIISMTKSVVFGYSTGENMSIWGTNLKTIIKINGSLLKPKLAIIQILTTL